MIIIYERWRTKLVEINETGYTRKIDPMGRVGIPIKIRKDYGVEEGAEYPIVIIKTDDGSTYCGIKLGQRVLSRNKIEKIISDLDVLNVEIPDELFELLDDE